ncbi:MAG: hypothetical protein ACRDY7_18770, partial [Acidimicrobiia bacterium]
LDVDGGAVQESAAARQIVGQATADGIALSSKQVEAVVTALCADREAERAFAEGLAGHQVKVIMENLAARRRQARTTGPTISGLRSGGGDPDEFGEIAGDEMLT